MKKPIVSYAVDADENALHVKIGERVVFSYYANSPESLQRFQSALFVGEPVIHERWGWYLPITYSTGQASLFPSDPPLVLRQPPIYRKAELSGDRWSEFVKVMQSGDVFECDYAMLLYWLEVLPPRSMGREVEFSDGRRVKSAFVFAEGPEPGTAFWSDGDRYFGRRITQHPRNL